MSVSPKEFGACLFLWNMLYKYICLLGCVYLKIAELNQEAETIC